MRNEIDLPWTKIHDFLLMAGDVRRPEDFCLNFAEKAHELLPYDQARIYFLNDNGKICDMVLLGGDTSWVNAYLEHYSRIEGGRYSVCGNRPNQTRSLESVIPVSFDGKDPRFSREFIRDYIKPQGLRHSLSIFFHDATNYRKTVCTLDRTTIGGYSQREVRLTEVLQSHLDNLHKNLFAHHQNNDVSSETGSPEHILTRRELEVAGLICDGVTPVNIAKKLCLSKSTVYKHIANIHEKLQVSNRQELMLTMLRRLPAPSVAETR